MIGTNKIIEVKASQEDNTKYGSYHRGKKGCDDDGVGFVTLNLVISGGFIVRALLDFNS